MKEFQKVDKVFIKSNNTVSKIINRYLYCLIPFILFIIIYNLIWGSTTIIISLLKNIIISFITSIIIEYLFNLKNKKQKISKLILENQILTISFIIGLFSLNISIPIIIIASAITIIIKKLTKANSIYATLYGILFLIISKYFQNTPDTPLNNLANLSYQGTYESILLPYGNLLDYILGTTTNYLSPILSIISFIYLFHKKSIKYNIVFSYILTITFIMLSLGILNNMNIWYLLFQLTTGNLLFLSVFILPDYKITPTTEEGQRIYGIILAILTCILRFILPELSVIITLILGPILLTKLLNNISFKLKYNHKYYYSILATSIILVLITSIILNIII